MTVICLSKMHASRRAVDGVGMVRVYLAVLVLVEKSPEYKIVIVIFMNLVGMTVQEN